MVDAAPGDRSAGEATFPRLLLRHARVRGGAPAMREKHLGIWQTWTWTAVTGTTRTTPRVMATCTASPTPRAKLKRPEPPQRPKEVAP